MGLALRRGELNGNGGVEVDELDGIELGRIHDGGVGQDGLDEHGVGVSAVDDADHTVCFYSL